MARAIYFRAQIVLSVDALSCTPVAAWRARDLRDHRGHSPVAGVGRRSPARARAGLAESRRIARLRLPPPRFDHIVRLGESAIRRFGSRHRDEVRLRRDFFVTSHDRGFQWQAERC